MEYILTFETTNHAILAEHCLVAQGIAVRIMPLPGSVRAGCGICLRLAPVTLQDAEKALQQEQIPYGAIYQRESSSNQLTLLGKEHV